MKIDTQIQSQYKIQNKLKEHIKDRINERMEKHIKNIKNKNKIKIHTSNTIERENFNKLMKHVSDNQTELKADLNSIQDIYNITELENFKNSSDYEEMWNIAIDKWTRNWNFYREHLTNSILEKFQLSNKRQKSQTKEDYVELTGQNINGSAIGPQDIFIEHYDCDAEEITNVKYYELNKISTSKFKPLDLDMTKTEVQLLSKAQAVEIKAYAVAGTIKERVEWCSQHTNYIRANRPSYYVSDAQRTKILNPDEVRNELARLNLLKNTEYKPTRYNIFETILNTISPEEIVLDNMFSKASLIESGIYSKEQLVQERKRDLLHEYMRDREKPLQDAQSANALKLLELEQLVLLQTYKNYEQSLKWLRDSNINGYNFQIDQPSVNWKKIFDGAWLKDQILTIFGWPWYILEKMAIIYAMISMILFITNLIIKFYNAFAIHKAIGKQASITKILLTGIFGIFSQTLTQLVAQIQEENLHDDSDDNNSHYGNLSNKTRKSRPNFRRLSAEVTTSNHNNNEPQT